ncbi:MAG: thioredoxin fold domain-containing protein [Undibacterium sp.]|nr:thioredoxin fold domain-containing protein [Undibacterium sp.]
MKILSAAIASIFLVILPSSIVLAADKAASASATEGINWRKDNDVDAAFALAKASHKPLFLYWGAVWCPPCNQVKATIFNRQDFIDKSRHFVPVYLDGDTPGAQKLAARFKVRGYPTMILLKADGSEITRLPGEVDSERYVQVLTSAMNASLSVQDTLKLALGGSKKLTAEDWSLLADYSWDDPEQKLVSAKELAPTLLRLSELSPAGLNATRLYLKAIAASATVKPGQTAAVIDKAVATDKLIKVLQDNHTARDNIDLLAGVPVDVVAFLTQAKSESRAKLAAAWNAALVKLADDTTLSKTDRLGAIGAQVALVKMDGAKPDAGMQKELKKRVAQIDQATTDAYERQSVVNAAAHALGDAGLLDDSDILLKAELKRSHSPYYFMSTLGANARQRGDKVAAVNWYEQAYNASKGPATRLQWGASYISNMVELSPADEARIEKAAHAVLSEIAATENAFYERNRASLERIGKKLNEWNKDGKHQVAVQKVRQQLDGICARLPANDTQRLTCQNVMAKS